LINARKGQRLYPDHLRFLARGVYELHCLDDPADPVRLIIDVSEHDKGKGRLLRPHIIRPEQSISFDEFDDAVRQFLKALELAGVALPPDGIDSVIDLFRKK
jgi:hypothetical protein